MPRYYIKQDAGSIGDADDCWSVYQDITDEGEVFTEVIATAQTETLAKLILRLASGKYILISKEAFE